jgi:signal transduction histidine kinase
MLDDLGLRPTLVWHVERYTRQTGISVLLQCDDLPNRFSTEIETTAYRIVQEALTNVARYAGVKEVHVDVRVDDDKMWVEIVDKGNGFDFEAIRQKPSSGLGGMRERVDLVGGKLLIRSYVGQGTQIVASLPLADRPVERRKRRRA